MLPQVLIDLALFCLLIPGLGLFIDRRIRTWDPLERLCMVAGVSFALIGAFASVVYLAHLPRYSFYLLPVAAFAQIVLQLRRRQDDLLFNRPEIREAGLAWGILACWCLGLLALVVNYSGGGWAADWFEHYQRTRFFLDRLPLNTLFLDSYEVTARPPLGNLVTGACLGITGVSFSDFQVFTTLFATLAYLPLLLLATRFSKLRDSSALPVGLVILCMTSPFFIQNATFAWTKLPTTFFILSALAFLNRSLDAPGDATRARAAWVFLAVGMLVHYSAGPWIVGAVLSVAAARFLEFRRLSFWREQAISAVLSLLVLSPWLLWAVTTFGTESTLASNSSARELNRNNLGDQLAIIGHNCFNTVVPFFLRTADELVLRQTSAIGALRDFFFSLYQVNLIFILGSAGAAACAWILFAGRSSLFSPHGRFWLVLLSVATVVGIACSSFLDTYGVAHLCQHPMALLGLALLASGWKLLGKVWRVIVASFIAADFLFGVVLHFGLQSFLLNRWLAPGLSDKEHALSMSLGSRINYSFKEKLGEPFLGDLSIVDHWGVILALAILLLLVLRWSWLRSCQTPSTKPVTSVAAAYAPVWSFLGWRVSSRAIVFLAAVLSVVAATWMLKGTFMMYDDEGYVLFSLKNFSEHGRLYEEVFSQYGAFYFLFNHALHLCGLEFSNSAARLLNLVYWTGCAFFSTATVWHLARRNLAATIFTLGSSVFYLWPMISEPSHPGAFIAFTLAALAWLGCNHGAKPTFVAIATGVAGAALVLTKINVGVFLLAGAGTWFVLNSEIGKRWPILRWGVMALFLTIPWALMRTLLSEQWVFTFAWVTTMSGAGVLVACSVSKKTHVSVKTFAGLGLAFAGTAFATLLLVHLRNTSWEALLEGMVFAPFRMPTLFTGAVKWRMGAGLVGALSLGLAIFTARRPVERRAVIVLPLRLLAVAVFGLCWWEVIPVNIHALVMSYCLALSWVFVIPSSADDDNVSARAWLALLLVPQAMHAYPVAGTQLSWGTFLWIPLAVLGLYDGGRSLDGERHDLPAKLWRVGTTAVILLSLLSIARFSFLGWDRYRDGEALELPGARNLILPENYSSTLRILVANASLHGDMLFSIPGQFSLNLWTGLPGPTLANATHWFTLLTPAQQEKIRERLEAEPRSCIILEQSIYDFLKRTKIATESPLMRWIHDNYRTAFVIETYEFLVPKNRQIAAVGTANLQETKFLGLPRFKMKVDLNVAESIQVSTIELVRFNGGTARRLASWSTGDARTVVTPLGIDGSTSGKGTERFFPIAMRGLQRLEIYSDHFPNNVPFGHCGLRLLDAQGKRVAEARFVE